MEARRLAILCSHLNPAGPYPTRDSTLKVSDCSSGSAGDEKVEASKLQNDCVFCKIIRGDSPCLKLYEDDMCLCFLDTSPLSHGHSLIIPKLHYPTLEETPPSVVAAMCSKVPLISNAIVKATGSDFERVWPLSVIFFTNVVILFGIFDHLKDSFNLLVNNGAAAGQVIFHTHIHIIPRKERDCLWASESLRRHSLKLDKEASQLVSRVRQQLCSLPEEQLVQPS